MTAWRADCALQNFQTMDSKQQHGDPKGKDVTIWAKKRKKDHCLVMSIVSHTPSRSGHDSTAIISHNAFARKVKERGENSAFFSQEAKNPPKATVSNYYLVKHNTQQISHRTTHYSDLELC